MAQPTLQPSFAAGELSPSLYGRVDLAKWHVAAALLRNFFVDYRGGVSNRQGTAFVAPCLPGTNRLIPFTFSTLQTYALLFSDQAMRVIMDGALVLEPARDIILVGPGTFPTALLFSEVVTDWQDDDWVYISGIESLPSPYPLNGNFYRVVRTGAPDQGVWLKDLDGNPIDNHGWGTYTGGGTAARVYTLATPYAAADLALLKYAQSADTMTLCHPSYAPQQLTRSGHASWAIAPCDFTPTAPAPVLNSATPSQTGDGTQYTYVVTAIASNGVTESLPSNAVSAVNSKTMSATASANITVSWTAVATAQYYNVYRQAEVPGGAAGGQQLYGFIGSCTGTTFVDANIEPDFTRTPPQNYNPFAGSNNPGCTTYYQARQAFAGSNIEPQTIRLSKSGDFLNFGYSSPSRPDDSIVAPIAATEVNAIKHLVPMDALIALTSKSAFKIDAGSQGGAVTPSAIEAVPQAYNGCSDVPPITINQDILYVQSKGAIVRDLSYNFYAKVYTGSDLTVLSNHLFFGHQIVEWTWAEEPFKIIWAIRDDGILLSFTFLKEQDVYAWAHHDTDGQFKSLCSISEGQEDAVYFVVSRRIGNKYVQYVERLASRMIGAQPELDVPADFSKFWFVDCGLQSTLTTFDATLTPAATNAEASVSGALVVVGGSGYTAPVITIQDETGSGATAVATLSGGKIVAVSITSAGTGYKQPVAVVTDSTGSGAVIALQITRDVDMQADSPVFGSVSVGDLVIVNGGYGYVRDIPSASLITVNVYQPLANIYPAPAGSWSVTAPVSTIYGLHHLEGRTVAILADGNVQPNQVVTNGRITLEQPASAVVVGLPYTAQLRSLYLDLPGEPTVQGKRKQITAVTLRQQDSRGMKVGYDASALMEFKERQAEVMGAPVAAFTGDRRVTIPTQYDVAGQLLVQQDYPLPATILALIPEVTVGDN